MVEVDGIKYISEEEFNNAVKEELYEISGIAAKHVVSSDIGLMEALIKTNAIAESYAHLRVNLFSEDRSLDFNEQK